MPSACARLGWEPERGVDGALRISLPRRARSTPRVTRARGVGAMRILVTGGTGFLGRRVVAELAPRHQLRLLVRSGASRERFPAGVEFVAGDVTDRASLALRSAPAATPCSTPRRWSRSMRRAAEFDRINVGGLENVLARPRTPGRSQRSSTCRASSPWARPRARPAGCWTSALELRSLLDQRLRAHQGVCRPTRAAGDRGRARRCRWSIPGSSTDRAS